MEHKINIKYYNFELNFYYRQRITFLFLKLSFKVLKLKYSLAVQFIKNGLEYIRCINECTVLIISSLGQI